jgi:hypothetical protein
MAMKLTLGILATAMMVSGAWAQNPDAIETRAARKIAAKRITRHRKQPYRQQPSQHRRLRVAPAVIPGSLPQRRSRLRLFAPHAESECRFLVGRGAGRNQFSQG